MPPERSPSCGSSSASRGPGLVVVLEVVFAAELQQRKTVLGEWNWLPSQLGGHSRVVEDRVPYQVRQKHFQEGRSVSHRSFPIGEEFDRTGERLLRERHEYRRALLLCGSQRRRQLAEGL